ncbi:kinase-like domain-containing protein [Cercophora scortea]|uniref:dual-specificity kinase n=1 Tax=Cercophora scortea TaxID=314031 RepID=A0AAE0IWH7_9PEZI|nr:kinase-like domain-containing protein [Cercophora scortea]
MSTPTTATATLPHYNPHHFSYTHHQHQSYPQPNTSSFRSANPIPASSRLPYPSPAGYSATSSHAGSNGLSLSSSSSSSTTSRSLQQDPATLAIRPESNYTTMAPAAAPAAHALNESQQGRKRRRSREPDWSTFYKNGLPKEIIVIDDTPEPQAAPTSAGNSTQALVNGHANGIPKGTSIESSARHLAKKRKRNEEPAHYDPVYHSNLVGSHTSTPRRHASPSKSTVSSDRTNSAIHTTAATSLGSLSSNGQYDYELQTGQKRKRTTRQQIALEAKRREAGVLDALASYQPPPFPVKKAQDVHVKVISDGTHPKNSRVDDDDGHYIVVPDNDLTDRYQMIKLLGQGTFGKVVQARDKRRNKLVAIKIIRSVQKYRDASKIELRVLATLKANDEENRNRCIHLRDCFDYRGHICIVMDLLGQSVFDFLKSNNFVPFPNSQIQNFARQLFTSVAFLHDLQLIHTDLKPENILLCANEYQTFTYNRKIPSSSSTVSRQATQRKVLLDTEIRLIDFGSATFEEEYHSSVVSTRHYRAPEIILGLGWSFPCDIWSIGCILVEFFTGDALFQTHDNLEHLAMMEAVVNSRIDQSLVAAVNKMTRNGGNPAAKYFKRLKLDYPTPETTRASRRFVKAMKRLDEIIPTSNKFLSLFLDLLQKIFVYDPKHRITAKGALDHAWFRECAHADDGTEAARIREEKEAHRLRQQHMEMAGTRLPAIHPS